MEIAPETFDAVFRRFTAGVFRIKKGVQYLVNQRRREVEAIARLDEEAFQSFEALIEAATTQPQDQVWMVKDLDAPPEAWDDTLHPPWNYNARNTAYYTTFPSSNRSDRNP